MNNYQKYLIPALIAGILGVGVIYLATRTQPADESRTASKITNFEECVEAGNAVMESYPAQCRTDDGQTFTQDIGNELEVSEDIRSTSPRPNQTVSSPLEISGEAKGNWFFEASFPAQLVDATGKQLAMVPITAQGEWMTINFVPYKGTITFSTPTTSTGFLILKNSNASGLPENDKELRIPVKFAQYKADATQTSTVKVFFNNSGLNAECEDTVPTNRTIAQTSAVGRAAIEELLKGVTADEKTKGYTSPIPAGTKLNTLTIENGVAKADFSAELEQNSGGSCRALAIRSQITETLKQFPTVKTVEITVNGKTDVLQP